MPDDIYRNIRLLLASTRPDEIHEGLKLAEIEAAKTGFKEAEPLFEMVSSLFYIDPLDHPEFISVLDEAVNVAVRFGPSVIPVLMSHLDKGDIKAQWAFANVLGRIGEHAIQPMIKEYTSADDPTVQSFILYALGKVKSPSVVQAAELAIEAAQSANLELRDTASRALGKFAESIPPRSLSKDLKLRLIDCLRKNLSDSNAGVRSKAIRSLGKMARYGHLEESESEQLKAICRQLTGADGNNEWDRAYIVRKEAQEALESIK